MEKEEFYLGEWRKIAERTLGWEADPVLSDYDFEKLSGLIFDKNNTRLSVSTLKRIWGKVRYESTPAVTTLNALANFLDFPDWRIFKQHIDRRSQPPDFIPDPAPQLSAPQPSASRSGSSGTHKKLHFLPLVLMGLMTVMLLYLFLSWATRKDPPGKPLPVQVDFESLKTTEGLPNSVVFDYKITGYQGDSVYIQQSWDPNRREKIPAEGRQYTSIYYYPGYFAAKLMVDGLVKKENTVFIQTKGWVGILDRSPVPSYLSNADIHLPEGLGITEKVFTQKTGGSVFNDALTSFYNIRPFRGMEGGHFKLTTTLRNTSRPEISSCRKLTLYLLGSRTALIIPLAERGCIAALDVFAGDHWIFGKRNDLSAFGCDMNKFQELGCSADKGQLTISLNGRPILTTGIKQTIGDIVGLRISFEGTGIIKQVTLEAPGQEKYEDHFR